LYGTDSSAWSVIKILTDCEREGRIRDVMAGPVERTDVSFTVPNNQRGNLHIWFILACDGPKFHLVGIDKVVYGNGANERVDDSYVLWYPVRNGLDLR
jgi:hypothetical protein